MAVPNIEDSGRDGPHCIDTLSDAGAWAAILPFCLNVRILPDAPFQRPLNVSEGCGDTDATASLPGSLSTHDNPNSPEVQHDHD